MTNEELKRAFMKIVNQEVADIVRRRHQAGRSACETVQTVLNIEQVARDILRDELGVKE